MNVFNLALKTKKDVVDARMIAFFIDYGIIAVVLQSTISLQNDPFLFFLLGLSVIYFVILETLFGCTVGKFIMHLRVVDRYCNKPSISKAIIRSLLRCIMFIHPSILWLWVLEYFIARKSKFKQRLFDRLASTFVVNSKELEEFKANSKINSMSVEDYIFYHDQPKIDVLQNVAGDNYFDGRRVAIEFGNEKLKIKGIEGMSVDNILSEINNGARFVLFYEVLSLVVISQKTPSDIYFIRAGENRIKYHIRHSLVTMIFGWWGIPGIIWTISSLNINFKGGVDVTDSVLAALKFNLNG
jgi:uncharacterized RDD family membrane protein YckC